MHGQTHQMRAHHDLAFGKRLLNRNMSSHRLLIAKLETDILMEAKKFRMFGKTKCGDGPLACCDLKTRLSYSYSHCYSYAYSYSYSYSYSISIHMPNPISISILIPNPHPYH